MQDMVATYVALLEADGKLIDGEAFNAGTENHTVKELALLIRETLDNPEHRHRVCAVGGQSLVPHQLGQDPRTAGRGAEAPHRRRRAQTWPRLTGRARLQDPMKNPAYYNIKTMQKLQVK